MKTIDAIARTLKTQGIEYLSCFPTTSMIEAAAQAGIRPIICRQERVGVHIADGYSRVTNGATPWCLRYAIRSGNRKQFFGRSHRFL